MSEGHLSERTLNDYTAGELLPERVPEVTEHLADCSACRAEVAGLRSLLDELGELPDRIAPDEQLWPGIAASIRPRDSGATATVDARDGWRLVWRLRTPLAAAAVLLMGLTTAVTVLVVGNRGSGSAGAGPGASASPADFAVGGSASAHATGPAWTDAVVADYADAIEELDRLLEARRGRLAPARARALEDNLRVIDRAIAESMRALEREPGNAAARRTVVYAHARKLDLLRRAVDLEGAS